MIMTICLILIVLPSFPKYINLHCGFVVRRISQSINCDVCIAELIGNNVSNDSYSLIAAKNKGGLIFPSQNVIKNMLQK